VTGELLNCLRGGRGVGEGCKGGHLKRFKCVLPLVRKLLDCEAQSLTFIKCFLVYTLLSFSLE
jgi:hypothetical protein